MEIENQLQCARLGIGPEECPTTAYPWTIEDHPWQTVNLDTGVFDRAATYQLAYRRAQYLGWENVTIERVEPSPA